MGVTVAIDSLDEMCGLMCDNHLPARKMKRIVPGKIYRGLPCSVVALGCALKIGDSEALQRLYSPSIHADGYLSLDGMNRLVRANMGVIRRVNYRRGERPCLRDFCHRFDGKAVVCVAGHFVYVEDGNYYSFFKNGNDEVICVWEVR